MKSILEKCFLLTLVCLSSGILKAQDLWDGKTVASNFYAGTGTEADPYQIRTGAQMMYFAQQVNSGNDFNGKTVKLMNDIDMNRNTESYLYFSKVFAGTFDGNCHILTYQFRSYGLFSQVSGRIHHFGINATVYRPDRYPFYGEIGIVNSLAYNGVLEDCYYSISNSHLYGVSAALARNNMGTIRNCYVTGSYTIYESYNSGLLVYMNESSGIVENCSSTIVAGSKQYPIVWLNSGTLNHNTNVISELNEWVDANPSHSRWCADGYRLVDFNPGENCTVEFIDTLFHQIVSPVIVNTGECIGTLPKLTSTWSHTGWIRGGKEVSNTDEVNSNWTLFARWEQLIKKQPTIDDMSFEADDEEHASYQWYAIYGESRQLGSWKSTNHGNNSSQSDTIKVTVTAGQSLKFNYIVSSELGCDIFRVYCNGACELTESGEQNGVFTYEITESGNFTLVLRYSKDEDTSRGDDNVVVSNICVSDSDSELPCTSNRLPISLFERSGLYYCKIKYSNTGKILSTDTINVEVSSPSSSRLTVTSSTICKGGKIKFPVLMENEEEITAFQFDVEIPQGVTMTDVQLGERSSDSHTVDYSKQSDGSYRVIVVSLQKAPFSGNKGELVSLMLSADKDIEGGDYNIGVKNIVLTTTSKEKIYPDDVNSVLTVLNIRPGDADGDGSVDVADVVTMIDYILDSSTSDIIFSAADMNTDGEIDIFDVMIAINIILNRDNSARSRTRASDNTEEQAIVRATADGSLLGINDAGRFTAFQFDVEMADGMELTEARLNVNEGNHKLYFFKNGQNTYRVIGVSMDNSTLTGSGNDLIRLSFSKGGHVQISNIVFVTPQKSKIYFASGYGEVTGIGNIRHEQPEEIFNLSGRKVNSDRNRLPKGVYIINNRKVVIK